MHTSKYLLETEFFTRKHIVEIPALIFDVIPVQVGLGDFSS